MKDRRCKLAGELAHLWVGNDAAAGVPHFWVLIQNAEPSRQMPLEDQEEFGAFDRLGLNAALGCGAEVDK